MSTRLTRKQLEEELQKAREQIAQFEEQEHIRQRYESLFEIRNRALRIFFDSALKVEHDKHIPSVMCYSLQRICMARLSAYARYVPETHSLTLEATCDGQHTDCRIDERSITLTNREGHHLKEKMIRPLSDGGRYLIHLIPDHLRTDDMLETSYSVPLIANEKVMGVSIIHLPPKKDLILKDVIEAFISYWCMVLQRSADRAALLQSRGHLAQSEEEVRMIFDNCGVPMCVIDTDYTIVKYNKHFLDLWQAGDENLAGKKCYEVIRSKNCHTDSCILRHDYTAEPIHTHVQEYIVNDEVMYADVLSTAIVKNGKIMGYIEAIHDITEQKKMEAQLQESYDELKQKNLELKEIQMRLVESSKMSAVGTLSAGIAHEFNNILTIICGYLDMCKQSKNMDDISSALDVISDVTKRAKAITDGLLHFAQTDESQHKSVVNLQEVIEHTLVLTDKEFAKKGIKTVTEFEDVPPTYCFEHQLAQVFLSILSNACDAMLTTPRKILAIRLVHCTETKQACPVHTAHKDECGKNHGCIRLSFTDTGIGMSPEVKEKIFEPFFTTKGVLVDGLQNKAGTGLEMSTSYRIIKRHNGAFEVESQIGKGTTITIILPVDSTGGLLYD